MSVDWLNRLGKWRSVLAGWQLGTRADTDAECQAVRDHREATLMLRAEVNALTQLLVAKGVFTEEEHYRQVSEECRLLCKAMERRFPGARAIDIGMEIYDPQKFAATTRHWQP